jgi:hypothetical protein
MFLWHGFRWHGGSADLIFENVEVPQRSNSLTERASNAKRGWKGDRPRKYPQFSIYLPILQSKTGVWRAKIGGKSWWRKRSATKWASPEPRLRLQSFDLLLTQQINHGQNHHPRCNQSRRITA